MPFAISPLFAFLFDPFLAAAAVGGAVSIPIVIHLLNRKRYRIVPWAAMRFLLAAQRKTSRKVRIEQILLLVVRCLLILLLLLAMCSVTGWAEDWFWHPLAGKGLAGIGGAARTHKIIVVDGSLGMGFKAGDQDCFEKARAAAKQIVKESNGGDGFSVVLLADPPRMIVPGPTDDAEPGAPSEDMDRVQSRLDALRPTHGNADLAAALNTVEDLLKASPRKYAEKEVYFLSNLQHTTWLAGAASALKDTVHQITTKAHTAAVLDVARIDDGDGHEKRMDNLAVEGLSMADAIAVSGQETLLQAVLHNFGATRKNVAVHLFVGKVEANGQPPDLREVLPARNVPEIKDGEQTTISFQHTFPEPGDYVVRVGVDHDGLEADDSRCVLITIKKNVRVLLVDGKQAHRSSDGAADIIRLALNPFPDKEASAIKNNVVARTTVISDTQFGDEGRGDLSDYDCVFLCDVPTFTVRKDGVDGEAERLRNFVRHGGGVVFVAGDRVDPNEYNNILTAKGVGLLPFPIVGRQTETDAYSFHWFPQPDLEAEPAFRPFTTSGPHDLLQVPYFRSFLRVDTAASGAAPNAAVVHTLMSFKAVPLANKEANNLPPDGPAVLEWRPPSSDDAADRSRLPGRVVLVTSTLNGDWDHLEIDGAAPVFIDRLMQFAAAGRLREQSIEIGEPIEVFVPDANGGAASIHTPDGREESVPVRPLDDGGVVRWAGVDVSGVYSVSASGGSTHLVAVNPPALNAYQGHPSDLTRAGADDLKSAFPDFQLVNGLDQVKHASGGGVAPTDPVGPAIAHVLLLILLGLFFVEVLLAWLFGHYTAVAPLEEEAAQRVLTRRQWTTSRLPLYLLAGLFAAFLLGVGFILIHNASTGDFLSFVPDGVRGWWEGRPPLTEGESRHWTLEASSISFWNRRLDPWLTGAVFVLGTVLVLAVYFSEGRKVGAGHRLLLAGLRLGLLALLLLVVLPQLRVWYNRQGAPDMVLILDDSKSMSTVDRYRDPKLQAAADALAKQANVSEADRLRLAQTIVTRPETDWLRTLLTQRNVRLHIYHCSSSLHRLADVSKPDELGAAVEAIQTLPPDPPADAAHPAGDAPASARPDRAARFAPNDSTQLGGAVRQVLAEYNASSLAAIVVLTDGVTTNGGEGLGHVADAARDQGVPLFFVGLGDADERHNLRLHDLQAVDSVYVNDHIIFELKLHGVGYPGQTVPVTLKEKGKDEVLDKQDVTLKSADEEVKVQLQYKPTTAGERTFVIETPLKDDESDKEDNRLERKVYVREAKLIRVLYIEGYRRYEYHFLKTLLERESDRVQGNKTMELKVVLMSADPGFEDEERNALKDIPSKEELKAYDVILLGDVDPRPKGDDKMTEHLKDIAEWVTDHGGGLLMIAGERYAPFAYKDSPLRDVLPIEVVADHPPDESNVERTEGFKPDLTPDGERHPIFRFEADAAKNKEAWDHLREMYWWSDVCVPKRSAEVLAYHPKAKGPADKDRPSDRQALVVTQFVGAGRTMFLGFSETWRWGYREDQRRYNQFWIQMVRYLSGSRRDHVELYLDRETPYHRGEPIKVRVRFPDDQPPPGKDAEVKVKIVRRGLDGGAPVERTPDPLKRIEGSRATYGMVLTETPEGLYKFTLETPSLPDPKPSAECKVLAPPGEMDRLQMNAPEMDAAAKKTHGGFYTVANADDLLQDKNLRSDARVPLPAPVGSAWLVWAFPLFFLLALLALSTEWILRKQRNLV